MRSAFRILAVFDDCTRECLAAIADTSLSGLRVARELDRLIATRGWPKTIVSDNGTELTSNAILYWTEQQLPDSSPNWMKGGGNVKRNADSSRRLAKYARRRCTGLLRSSSSF